MTQFTVGEDNTICLCASEKSSYARHFPDRVLSFCAITPGSALGESPITTFIHQLKEHDESGDKTTSYLFSVDRYTIIGTSRPLTDEELKLRSCVKGSAKDFRFKLLIDLCNDFEITPPGYYANLNENQRLTHVIIA